MAGPWPVKLAFLKKKKVLILLGVLLAGLIIFLLWSRSASKNTTYLTENVARGDVINTITASGSVDSENTVPLIFKNSAVIKAIYVKEGQRVKKGDLLAEQDDRDLAAQYDQQMANLKAAEAKLALTRAGARQEEIRQAEENVNIALVTYNQAGSSYGRIKALFEQGAVAAAEKEKAENDFKLAEAKLNQAREQLNALRAGSRPEEIITAESQVDIARAQLKAALNNLDSAKMYAPDDGFIGQIGAVVGQRTSGATNNNNTNDGFITLISDRLRVRAQINEADVGRAAVGQKAFFTVNSYPDRKFRGVVESISPKAVTVANVQLYDVIIAMEQQETALKVGMPANVSIIVDQRAGVLMVPRIAVSYALKNTAGFAEEAGSAAVQGQGDRRPQGRQGSADGEGQRAAGRASGGEGQKAAGGEGQRAAGGREVPVLVLEKGNPVLRKVRTGISDNTNYEVTGGLREGEQVIIGSTGGTTRPGTGNQNPLPFGNTPRVTPRR